jgi:hypothetical protein
MLAGGRWWVLVLGGVGLATIAPGWFRWLCRAGDVDAHPP